MVRIAQPVIGRYRETKQESKMATGRPPIGKRAMTDAERHRRYMSRLTAARDERTALLQERERLRTQIALLKAQLKARQTNRRAK
jgi:hypothetical protein